MKSEPHIFISFKSEEREFAFRLKTVLEESGFKVWWQEEIQCGQEWHGEIDKAISDASAIVVLWSSYSMKSIWVKHEASHAIAKQIYAPVRIEVMEIDSPYNRIQATDMFNWKGDVNSPGFQNLLIRLRELMPAPVPVSQRIAGFIRKEIVAITLFLITTGALYLLLTQSSILKKQLLKQDSLLSNVLKTDSLLKDTKDSLDLQFYRVSEINNLISKNLTETSTTIADQFAKTSLNQQRLEGITDNIQNATAATIENLGMAINTLSGLDSSQKQVLNNIRRNLYPIDVNRMNISYQAYWDVNNVDLQNYVERVLKFAREQIIANNIDTSRFRSDISGYENANNWMDYSFDAQNVEIRYCLNSSNEIKIGSIFINDNSPLMPDCNDFYERKVSDVICSHRLYMVFSKDYDPTKTFTNQKYLRLISFTENKHGNCADRWLSHDKPAAGNSSVEINLQFDGDRDSLTFFHTTYKTNKIISDVNTGELVSVLDLLNADFNLSGLVQGTGIYPIQINDINISTSGASFGGISFGNGGNLQSSKTKEFHATYHLTKECFSGNIFNQ